MTKTSTVHFTINNLASKANEEILNCTSTFDFDNEFADVFQMLNDLSVDVPQEVVENILKAIPLNN